MMNRVLVIAAFSLLAALPSRAQNDVSATASRSDLSFEQIISGANVPLQMRFGEMDKSWRRMQISGSDEDLLSQLYNSGQRSPQPIIFYTSGKTVQVGDQSFIVAYKLPVTVEQPQFFDTFGNSRNWPAIPKQLTGESSVELSLINSRLVSRFSAIRVLDVAQELQKNADDVQNAKQQRTKAINQASLNNLKQIGQQLRSYTQSTGKLPPLQTSAAAQKALQRFGYSSPSPFVHPTIKKLYVTNAILSGKSIKQIVDTSRAIVFYENEVSGDGTRGVVFADGNAQRINENIFYRLNFPTERVIFKAPKILLGQKTVKLQGAAALAYIYNVRKNSEESYEKNLPQFYRSESSGRIYYREARNPQNVIFVAPPANPIVVPLSEAADYHVYAGYNGRKSGQTFGSYGYN